MRKKKIVFLAPKNEWWTYYYYKDISDYLIQNHSDEFDVYFCNSLFDYIKFHFLKVDIIFSIIPFLFKPLFVKRYIYNLHWNYKVERKIKWLWVKLLYLSELNLWFSDSIMLTSYYLADKLNFKNKYEKKIVIVPNFVKEIINKNEQLLENDFNFLTITSFKFFEKWKWILNLWKVIKQLWYSIADKKILFTIVWNEDNDNFFKIKSEFDKINFPNNVTINWKWWVSKKDLEKEFLKHNTFLYWTELDNYPWVVIDAINYNLKVFVNNFESFKYFLNDEIICKNEEEMTEKIMKGKYIKSQLYTIKSILNLIKSIISK